MKDQGPDHNLDPLPDHAQDPDLDQDLGLGLDPDLDHETGMMRLKKQGQVMMKMLMTSRSQKERI